MTVFESYTDRSDPRCYPLSYIIHLVETGTLLSQCSSNFVHQNRPGKSTIYTGNAKRSVDVQVVHGNGAVELTGPREEKIILL